LDPFLDSLTTTHAFGHGRRKDLFQGRADSGIFQGIAKKIFPEEKHWWNFNLPIRN